MEQSDLELLQTVPAYHLQAVLKLRHVPYTPAAANGARETLEIPETQALYQEIGDAFFSPAAMRKVWQALGELERLILLELVHCGGRANSRDLALYFSLAGLLNSDSEQENVTPAHTGVRISERLQVYQQSSTVAGSQAPQYPVPHPHGAFEQALRSLLLQGLVFWGKQTNFSGRDYTNGIHDGVLIVPLVEQQLIKEEERADAGRAIVETPRSEAAINDGIRDFQRLLYQYWSLVAAMREGLPLISTGLLARSALRHVMEQLGNSDDGKGHVENEMVRSETEVPRLLFVRLMLMRLNLLQERNGALFAQSAETYFSLSLLERVRYCYRLYWGEPFWNELCYLPDVMVRPAPSILESAHEEVVHARQLVCERLLSEERAKPLAVNVFIARNKLYNPYLLFPRQYGPRAERYSASSNPYNSDFRLRRGWLTHREGWHLVEGGFIRAMLSGPLQWLGLVEPVMGERNRAYHIAAGLSLLTDTDVHAVEAMPWGRLVVQPNFDLVALAPVSEGLLISLDRFAERVSMEHIAQYRLTRASVTRAIQRNLSAEKILHILEQAAAGDIPQNVRYSLVEWERQARRVEIWPRAALLEVDEAELLDELFTNQETRDLFARRLGPTLAEVVPHQLRSVQKILWQRNYLPALTSLQEQGSTAGAVRGYEQQWRLHAHGLLQPFYAVLDLYLVAELERFCARDEATGWHRLTEQSVQSALQRGITLAYILQFLQNYCDGGIPGSLLIQLKLWGGGYAEQQQVAVEAVPMLRLTEEVLRDIQQDEELQGLLGSEVEPESRLVRIAAEKLERVLELLRARGFQLEE